ncbi:MAG: hypothetical protein ACE366_29115 [Bradymonadia bacterium]
MMTPAHLLAVSALLLPLSAGAQDPDDFDPILDGQESPSGGSEPITPEEPFPLGFMIGAGGGLYFGRVKSYLDPDISRLESGLRPGLSLGLSGRTRSGWEIGLEMMVGFGRTFEPDEGEVEAFDLMVQPRVLYHFVEEESYGFYGGLGGTFWGFDLGGEGLNQGGAGPGAVLGLVFARDLHGHLYLELGTTALYDFLAYRFEDPTAEQLIEDPTAEPEKIEGEWFILSRVILGYRLTNF